MTRDEIVSETRSWIGTPYRHQQTHKGVGCDCLGLVRGVYRNFLGEEPEKTPNYSPTWGEAGTKEVLLRIAQSYLVEDNSGELKSGQVLIFRMQRGMIAKHCGIVGDRNTMIHAYQGVERVMEHYIVPYWKNRIVGVFDYPGVI